MKQINAKKLKRDLIYCVGWKMKLDNGFWAEVNQRFQSESFAYPERLRKLLKLIKKHMEEVTKESVEATGIQGKPFIVAIDGRAASGKSTLAQQLSELLDAEVIHMDDFFLPLSLRTKERLAEPGGNVHYERFAEEVIPYLQSPAAFSYRIFDCSKMDYEGGRFIGNKPVRIVEGSYSHHPKFGRYADLFVFSDVDEEEQMRRIRLRNGAEKAQMFAEKWIPMEERYFTGCEVKKTTDAII